MIVVHHPSVKQYQRDPKTNLAPPELKAIHALGKAPVIRDGDLVLGESGAIIEYLVERYGKDRLVPQARYARARALPALAALRRGHADAAAFDPQSAAAAAPLPKPAR